MSASPPAAAAAATTATQSNNKKKKKKSLRFIPTCDLYDQFLDDAKVPFNLNWHSYGGVSQFCGTAVTVKCWEDNSRIKELLMPAGNQNQNQQEQQQADNDDNTKKVLVVDAGGAASRVAVLGDLLAAAAAAAAAAADDDNNHNTTTRTKWAGIVIHGRVRDVAALSTINIGILALGHTPRKSVRRGEGQVQVPIQIGGGGGGGTAECNPGDAVYCDLDGVLILRPDQLSDEHYE